jgi:hypothetical protein
MKSRIDSVQAARFDKPATFPPTCIFAGSSHGSGPQDAQIGGDREHEENSFSNHFSLPAVPATKE